MQPTKSAATLGMVEKGEINTKLCIFFCEAKQQAPPLPIDRPITIVFSRLITCWLVLTNYQNSSRESLLIRLDILAGNPTQYSPQLGYSMEYSEALSLVRSGYRKLREQPISSALPWKNMIFHLGFQARQQMQGTLDPDQIGQGILSWQRTSKFGCATAWCRKAEGQGKS